MKILICHDDEKVRAELRLALEGAGHQVVAGAEPYALASEAESAGALGDASALLVQPSDSRKNVAILRERGFAGRALMAVRGPQEQPGEDLSQYGVEGVLALSPASDLVPRFARAMGGRRRVLVVEASEPVAKLIQRQVDEAGFEVSWAPDVERATRLVTKRATRPDLVLVDLDLPRVNGRQFCRFLKRNDRFRSIKVVFCSNEKREAIAAAAAECGADGYVSKRAFIGPAT